MRSGLLSKLKPLLLGEELTAHFIRSFSGGREAESSHYLNTLIVR